MSSFHLHLHTITHDHSHVKLSSLSPQNYPRSQSCQALISIYNNCMYPRSQSCQTLISITTQFGTSLSTHISNFDDIGKCWIFAVLWRPFWKWRPVEIFQCRESIRDIINIYPHIQFWWYQTMLNFYRPFFMPCFGSHCENGRHLENFENAELLL